MKNKDILETVQAFIKRLQGSDIEFHQREDKTYYFTVPGCSVEHESLGFTYGSPTRIALEFLDLIPYLDAGIKYDAVTNQQELILEE